MKIGLHDADAEHLKSKTFPNYTLMKISAYHKEKGDQVEWWIPLYNNSYDRVYSSKVFDFTPENIYLPDCTIKGGTGYDIKSKLPEEIESMYPDYSIYPDCDYAIGFLTRGCPNNCPWCYVPEKEGNIKPYRTWQELIRPDSTKLVLMDNNILACEYGIEQLKRLAGTDIYIDLNQGMDIRLVTEEIVKIYKKLNWIRFIRFSCDTKGQLEHFKRVAALFRKYEVGLSKMFIYVLVTKDLKDADCRVQELNAISPSLHIYAQAERNERKGIIPNELQLEFTQRYIYGHSYRKEDFETYCIRKNLYTLDFVRN